MLQLGLSSLRESEGYAGSVIHPRLLWLHGYCYLRQIQVILGMTTQAAVTPLTAS